MTYLKPLPQVRDENRPFWEGLRDHVFKVLRCDSCGTYNWPAYPACRACLSESLTWTEVSGKGTLYSFTVVHRGPGQFNEDVPYVIAMVKLDVEPGAPVVLATVQGESDGLEIGMPMEVVYEEIEGEDITLYRFVPATATAEV